MRIATPPPPAPNATPRVIAEIADGEGLSLSAAAALMPPIRSGRPVSLGCMFRWCSSGAVAPDGSMVLLEAARLGRSLVTSKRAIRRFIERLSAFREGGAA